MGISDRFSTSSYLDYIDLQAQNDVFEDMAGYSPIFALYGVSASDPISWIAAVVVLLTVSVLANLVPAWRAARVNPSIALRTE
jgi:ABC-type antimicrobial peptide transport system permease subunit